MERTTLYLPSDLAERLRGLARRKRRSLAWVVREALERYLSEQERPVPSSLGAGEDAEVSAADSEDWLRARWSGRS